MRLPRRLRHDQTAELVEHLGELRSRLMIMLLALAGGFALAYGFHHELLHWLNQPLPPGRRRPVTFGVAEPFTTSLKVSLYAGFALALPVILWQLWSFLAPAIDPRTERAISGLVLFASGLFVSGVAFAYKLVLPAAVHYLTTYDAGFYNIQIRASSYYSFTVLTLLAIGLVFELPVFVLALVRIGALTSAKLRSNRRTGYFVMAVLAVALPGLDWVTTAFEIVPLITLFELSIWLSVLFERRWRTADELAAAET
jgi:sec-independent protein translocase protein TatC